MVRDEVALFEISGIDARELAVHTALDLRAEHEDTAAGAVVGAGTVVPHAAAELGEQHHDHVVIAIVSLDVVPEVRDCPRQVGPELLEDRLLIRVRIEADQLRVEDASAEVGAVDRGDVFEAARDLLGAPLDGGLVAAEALLENVGALERVEPGAAEVLLDVAGADRAAVHVDEALEHLLALPLLLNAGQETVGREVGDGCNSHTWHDQRAGQALSDMDASDRVFASRVEVTDGAPDPALGTDLVGLTGVPDVHRAEM